MVVLVSRIDAALRRSGLLLPSLPTGSRLAPAVRSGQLIFVSGYSSSIAGKLGAGVSIEAGAEAAREAMLACLAEARWLIGDLDRIVRVVKLLGFINCTPDFLDHPAVLDGATDLLLEIFGRDKGWHARSAVGSPSLDQGAAVEVEAIFEIAQDAAIQPQ